MPELPEVETVRAGLAAEVAGRRVVALTVTGRRSVRRHPVADLAAAVEGAVLGPARRLGKYLVLPLDRGQGDGPSLVVHLRMSGQLRLVAGPAEAALAHTHVVLDLDDGRQLRFIDPRTFGELFVTAPGAAFPGGLGALGPDPLDPAWSVGDLGAALAGRRALLKALLMDQRRLAGLGNIYSDEALFGAGLRYDRAAGSLSAAEVARLHGAIRSVLGAAVEHRGSSLSDAQYVDLHGRPGRFQSLHQVYAREGQGCFGCGAPIERRKAAGRSTFFCPRCQS